MTNGKATQNSPYKIEVTEGETYFWCACGLSSKQPFCDGSHKGSDFTPIKYTADETKTAAFCGCRSSENQPLCDGTHRKLDDS
ncbi:MAG: CDGSH iron-sulfur domain-containing protein [Gammaproteobacteria bacterium]|nr:CDGSH iron-sulfur domain-containing protein [Gammaproteobacteria bacterium]